MSDDPGKDRPRVTVSVAVTIDGFLDTVDEERLVISSEEDMEEVHRLRAESDAILVGAETIRKDDCSLTARGENAPDHQPLRVTVTRSGNLDPSRKFFSAAGGKNLVFCTSEIEEELRGRLGPDREVLALESSGALAPQILSALHQKGVKELLVEGGTTIITEFVGQGLVDRLRLSIGPLFVGDKGKNRLVDPAAMNPVPNGLWRVQSVNQLGGSVVIWYEATDDQGN